MFYDLTSLSQATASNDVTIVPDLFVNFLYEYFKNLKKTIYLLILKIFSLKVVTYLKAES